MLRHLAVPVLVATAIGSAAAPAVAGASPHSAAPRCALVAHRPIEGGGRPGAITATATLTCGGASGHARLTLQRRINGAWREVGSRTQTVAGVSGGGHQRLTAPVINCSQGTYRLTAQVRLSSPHPAPQLSARSEPAAISCA
ncbi:MAG: hypothetical protein ACR2GX_02555 [Candidatus Dormibacteria bacterium]